MDTVLASTSRQNLNLRALDYESKLEFRIDKTVVATTTTTTTAKIPATPSKA